jgi:SAM-dependent methyltransferase
MSQTTAGAGQRVTFDPEIFKRFTDVEDRHFWFQVRNRIIATLVGQLTAGLPAGFRVLEVGCGTGVVLRALEPVCRRGRLTGMDLYEEGLAAARRRLDCTLIQGDALEPPALPEPFDVVGSFDMIEHLEDDRRVLRNLAAMTRPGGALVVTVPANPKLWSYFDEANHHCRRYVPDDLAAKATEAGFEVEYLSHFMATIFPLVWLKRRFSNLFGRRLTWAGNRERQLVERELTVFPVVNGLLARLLAPEVRAIARRKTFRHGTSLILVGRKKAA